MVCAKPQYPETVADAVDLMMGEMKEGLSGFSAGVRKKMIAYNIQRVETPGILGIGMYVRNRFGLWQGNHAMGRDCKRIDHEKATATWRWMGDDGEFEPHGWLDGDVHPDDAGAFIVDELLRQLKALLEQEEEN